jgi:hypothetical protein
LVTFFDKNRTEPKMITPTKNTTKTIPTFSIMHFLMKEKNNYMTCGIFWFLKLFLFIST